MNLAYFCTDQSAEVKAIEAMATAAEKLEAIKTLAEARWAAAEKLGIGAAIKELVESYGVSHIGSKELIVYLPGDGSRPDIELGYDTEENQLWAWQDRLVFNHDAYIQRIIPGPWLKYVLELNLDDEETFFEYRQFQLDRLVKGSWNLI